MAVLATAYRYKIDGLTVAIPIGHYWRGQWIGLTQLSQYEMPDLLRVDDGDIFSASLVGQKASLECPRAQYDLPILFFIDNS